MSIYDLQNKANIPFKSLNTPADFDFSSIFSSSNQDNGEFQTPEFLKLTEKFAKTSIKLTDAYSKNPQDKKVGYKILKNIHDFEKATYKYAEKHSIDYVPFLDMSTQDLKTNLIYMEKMVQAFEEFALDSEIPPMDKISFSGEKKTLTKEQKKNCHKIIHSYSAICAGISAIVGEATIMQVDIPFLLIAETAMFTQLKNELNCNGTSAFIYAMRQMYLAMGVGGMALKGAIALAGCISHPVAAPPTGGLGNLAITAAVRSVNALISAGLCESMGWNYVHEYKKGKMNEIDQTKATAISYALLSYKQLTRNIPGIDDAIINLSDKAGKALGISLFTNMPDGVESFITGASSFLQSDNISYAAKGIEIMIESLAVGAIENKGEINSEFIESTIKASLFSIVCSDLMGDIIEKEELSQKSKKIMSAIMHDSQLQKMFNDELIFRGIKKAGEIVLNKDAVEIIAKMFKELKPKFVEHLKYLA